jgi:polysaccharide pyruvyl transferase WcaK-like protein
MTRHGPTQRSARHTGAPRVGLFGLLGSGNLGNDVSMESVLRYLRTDHPEAVVDAMCKGPGTVASRHGIPTIPMNWYHRYERTMSGLPAVPLKLLGKGIDVFRTVSWVSRHEVVIVPGMGVMEAGLPLKPWQMPYSFFLLCASAKPFGAKVAFVGIGASVVKRRTSRVLLDASARLASYRSYRDVQSRDVMGQRGLNVSRDPVYSDLAFGFPPLPCGPGDPGIVGVNVMGYRGGDDDRKQAEAIHTSYVATMKSFVRWLIDQDRSVRILIGDENEPDRLVGEEILADVRSYCPDLEPGRVVAEYASSFAELMQVMAPVGTVVATRFHSVICALRLGKPVLSLGYGPKFSALVANMGLAEFCQLAKYPDFDVLIAQFTELEKRQEELRKGIADGNAAYERNAAAQFAELSAVLFATDDAYRKAPAGKPGGRDGQRRAS